MGHLTPRQYAALDEEERKAYDKYLKLQDISRKSYNDHLRKTNLPFDLIRIFKLKDQLIASNETVLLPREISKHISKFLTRHKIITGPIDQSNAKKPKQRFSRNKNKIGLFLSKYYNNGIIPKIYV